MCLYVARPFLRNGGYSEVEDDIERLQTPTLSHPLPPASQSAVQVGRAIGARSGFGGSRAIVFDLMSSPMPSQGRRSVVQQR